MQFGVWAIGWDSVTAAVNRTMLGGSRWHGCQLLSSADFHAFNSLSLHGTLKDGDSIRWVKTAGLKSL